MPNYFRCSTLIFSFCSLSFCFLAACSTRKAIQPHVAYSTHAMVASENKVTSEIARDILSRGGNAIDAAVAISFALSVYRPHSTGLGGGGFLLLYRAEHQDTLFLDFRERAPKAVTEEAFQAHTGDVYDPLYSGTPGIVAGLWEIHKRFGSLPWRNLVAPSIQLAKNGFAVYPKLASAISYASKRKAWHRYPKTKALLTGRQGAPLQKGEFLIQEELARSLTLIADQGPHAFYRGPLAEQIAGNGFITKEDLASYRPLYRTPLATSSAEYTVVSAPLPSSGGIVLGQFFGILSKIGTKYRPGSVEDVHQRAEVLKLAFSDRAKYLGDPGYSDIPVSMLLSDEHLSALAKQFAEDKVIEVDSSHSTDPTSTTTTHFSIFDSQGNVVSSTQSINLFFGSGALAGDTGIFLNNTLDDFSLGKANAFGLLGQSANSIEPGKTPLSSMSPTIVFRNKKPVIALGSPGGPMIISAVANVLLNSLEFGLSPEESVAAPRVHHQWSPNKLYLETENQERTKRLKALGHKVASRQIGNVSAVFMAPNGELIGVSDPRYDGAPAGF